MVYVQGKYLMADSVRELHQYANKLEIPYNLFTTEPFPAYLLDQDYLQQVKAVGIKEANTARAILLRTFV